MLSAVVKIAEFGWGSTPKFVRNLWLDILFGVEEPFNYESVTCPVFSSS